LHPRLLGNPITGQPHRINEVLQQHLTRMDRRKPKAIASN
jgi:hypothetical protein